MHSLRKLDQPISSWRSAESSATVLAEGFGTLKDGHVGTSPTLERTQIDPMILWSLEPRRHQVLRKHSILPYAERIPRYIRSMTQPEVFCHSIQDRIQQHTLRSNQQPRKQFRPRVAYITRHPTTTSCIYGNYMA